MKTKLDAEAEKISSELVQKGMAEAAAYIAATRAMLAALQMTRLQLHAVLAGKEALSFEKQLSILDATIIQAEQAGITTGEDDDRA